MFEIMPFKKNPVTKKDYFANLIDRVFDEDFAPVAWFGASFKVDIRETDDAYLVDADLPGFNKEAIKMTYDNNYLTICAKREEEIKEEKKNYIRQERNVGEIKRQFYVENVDENKIEANFADGVLKVVLPKKEKVTPEKKEIQIK